MEDVFLLYARIAAYGFRRHSAYRAAALAGAFTNSVFGILRAYVLIALWQARPGLAGYDVTDAVTFCFLSQAFIGPMQVFGGGLQLAGRVRSGDVAVDLLRPASLQLWSLADDLGRAAYLFLLRSLPPTFLGAALFGIVVPAGPAAWAAFAASFTLGVLVSFALRYLTALSCFWIVDDQGVQSLSLVLTLFLSGMVLPLNLFPGWFGELTRTLPWAAMVQVPADVYLGKRDVLEALAFQISWAAALLALGALATRAARRKVVVQGG
ncbi:ABC transporter permease [Planomonospora parontospora subsp. parontospora]|uniref:ABC transporter permease n=2 Tax=Planomonospora parontospora TaxID=58119 RepID=A0AA37F6B9_9ACTN|nr:ABC-2 family transporter protein [Planomonospora parontospora]GGK83478.1 ABC transporter permease [Planomonospora parontospora]GII10466.1 ABC transporter permease [Planomonospora parontospora subsp. parontospora]